MWPRVHPAGQHEAPHADPHQRPALPVPHLLQDLCAEADAQDPHDRALAREAIQVQGTGLSPRLAFARPGLEGLRRAGGDQRLERA